MLISLSALPSPAAAAWVEKHRDAITACLQQHTGLSSVVWRPALDMLREEGCAPEAAGEPDADAAAEAEAGVASSAALDSAATDAATETASASSSSSSSEASVDCAGAAASDTVVVENGVKYAASPYGQKTGFYCDQRPNRAAVRQLSSNLRVLDLCCYTGGFALNAAAGGATEVLGVDSSASAVEMAARNAALNGHEGVCSFTRADVTDFMKQVGLVRLFGCSVWRLGCSACATCGTVLCCCLCNAIDAGHCANAVLIDAPHNVLCFGLLS